MAKESYSVSPKVRPEDLYRPSDFELECLGESYVNLHKWAANRSMPQDCLQGYTVEEFWTTSRKLFWNALKAKSEDLTSMGIDFSIGFARKETLDFLGRLISFGIKPGFTEQNNFAVRTLTVLYNNWRRTSNDRTEKFWQLLYGLTNGTLALGVGFNHGSQKARFLKSYDPEKGIYNIEEKNLEAFNDVLTSIIPLEEIYFPELTERNLWKQGHVLRRQNVEFNRFKHDFKFFKASEYVQPGNKIAEDSLYLQLMGASSSFENVELLYDYNILTDEYKLYANGIWINKIGEQTVSPNPFNHKEVPIAWTQFRPLDNNFAYGMSLPFEIKDPDKLANVTFTVLVERELRAASPPILTSDIEAPSLIYGDNQVIQVSDVEAYKELKVSEPGQGFFTMNNALQGLMTSQVQGGYDQLSPSVQPKSAREAMTIEKLKQFYMANTMAMYYNLLWQEIQLVIKTMLQFYPADKYKEEQDNIIRSMMVPNSPLMQGGIGNLEVRLVKEVTEDPQTLWKQSLNKAIVSGKMTEIIEVPVETFERLMVSIGDITLEQDQGSELEVSQFMENVVGPMMKFYVPAGLADPGKLFLRHMEKLGESPSDFAPDSALPKLYNTWANQFKLPDFMLNGGKPIAPDGAPDPTGQTTGALNQSAVGMQNGPDNITAPQGAGPAVTPFGSPDASGVKEMMNDQAAS